MALAVIAVTCSPSKAVPHILTGLPHCKTISLQNTAGKLTCSKIFTVQKTDSKSKLCFKVTGNIRAGNLLTGKLINEQA